MLVCRSHVFRVGEGEAEELVLVQVHYDQFVCGSQVDGHLGELLVKVARVPAVPLQVGMEGGVGMLVFGGGVDVGGGLRDIAVEGGKWNGMGGGEEKKKEKTFLVTSLNGRAHLLKEAHSSSFGRRFKVRDLITDYLQFPYRSF